MSRLIRELALKDLRLFLADWRGVVLCFANPIVLASVFGAVFQRKAGAECFTLRAAVVVEDDSPLSANIATSLVASRQMEARRATLAEARRELATATSGVVFVLPVGFGESLRRGRGMPQVTILHRPGHGLEARLAEGLLTEVALREAARELLGKQEIERPFSVRPEAITGPVEHLDTYAHSFCGMSLQYLMFWGMDSGLLLLRERRQGIWRRLRTAPVGMGTILAGKALATAIVALAQILVTFTFGWLVFGVTIGSPIGFVLLAISAAVLSAATGLVVAALGGNENRARSVAILAILSVSMLGGLWLPAFLLPRWVQDVGLLFPTTWAARGLEGVTWQGMEWTGALPCALIVLAYSGVFLLLAVWGFSRSDSRLVGGER